MAGAFEYGSSTGGGKLRYQEFTASGTFTPSSKLLSSGGQVFLDLRAGGGGGGSSSAGNVFGGGGSSKHVTTVTVTGATSVVIGAGGTAGAAGFAGNSGGSSSFGGLTIPGAQGGQSYSGGAGTGNEGRQGTLAFWGANQAFTASQFVSTSTDSTTANTGYGGKDSAAGSAGYCRVWWFE